jgi:hypothetical protein
MRASNGCKQNIEQTYALCSNHKSCCAMKLEVPPDSRSQIHGPHNRGFRTSIAQHQYNAGSRSEIITCLAGALAP